MMKDPALIQEVVYEQRSELSRVFQKFYRFLKYVRRSELLRSGHHAPTLQQLTNLKFFLKQVDDIFSARQEFELHEILQLSRHCITYLEPDELYYLAKSSANSGDKIDKVLRRERETKKLFF